MATLNTLLVNGDSVNGPRNWTTQDFANIDEGISAADAAEIAENSNNTGTSNQDTAFLLSNTNSDLGNVDTLSYQIRYRVGGAQTNSRSLSIRIVKESDGTVLAAANSAGDFQTVATEITTTTFVNSSVVAFTYVNTGASKADWDDARVSIRCTSVRSMGGDTNGLRVDTLQFTGTYTIFSGTVYDVSITFATSLNQGEVNNLVAQNSLTLSNQVQQTEVGGKVAEESLTLDTSVSQTEVNNLILNESVNLTTQVDQDEVVNAILDSTLIFNTQIDQDELGNLLIEEDIGLDTQTQQDQSGGLTLENSLDLNTQTDISEIGNLTAETNLSLEVVSSQDEQNIATLENNVNLTTEVNQTEQANVDFYVSLDLLAEGLQEQSGGLIFEATLNFDAGSTFNESEDTLIGGVLDLLASNQLTAEALVDYFNNVNLNITVDQAQTVIAELSNSLNLLAQSSITFVDEHIPAGGGSTYEESITFSAIALLNFSGTLSILGVKKIIGLTLVRNLGKITWD